MGTSRQNQAMPTNTADLVFVVNRLDGGIPRDQVVTDLINEGFPPDAATHLVDEADLWRKQEHRKNGAVRFAGGIGLVLLGGIITFGSWYLTGPGVTYILPV